jgi:hypothetical protein
MSVHIIDDEELPSTTLDAVRQYAEHFMSTIARTQGEVTIRIRTYSIFGLQPKYAVHLDHIENGSLIATDGLDGKLISAVEDAFLRLHAALLYASNAESTQAY